MTKLRIYVDTSVIGGYFDKEFAEPTVAFFERIANKDFAVYRKGYPIVDIRSPLEFLKDEK